MHSEVLGACEELFVARTRLARDIRWARELLSVVGVALETAHYSEAHLSSQIGVFAISLLTTSPAGITEDIDVGRPE